MSDKLIHPGDVAPFASLSQTNERTVFGDENTESDVLSDNLTAEFLRGWLAGVDTNGYPPVEFFNALGYTTSGLVAYLYQRGVSEWDADQSYYHPAVVQVSGTLYKSVQDSSNQDPTTETAYWLPVTTTPGDATVALSQLADAASADDNGSVLGFDVNGEPSYVKNLFDAQLSSNNKVTTTANQTLTLTIREATLSVNAGADRVFTLPDLDADYDGFMWLIKNECTEHKLTVQPGDSTHKIWNSGVGHGIEIVETGHVFLRWNYDTLTWDIVASQGNWMIEGLELFLSCKRHGLHTPSSTTASIPDEKTHKKGPGVMIYGHIYGQNDSYYGYTFIDAASQTLSFLDDTAWDVLGDKVTAYTIRQKVLFDNLTSNHSIVGQREDSSNYWLLYMNSSEAFNFVYVAGGSTILSLTSASGIISDTTSFHDIVIAKTTDGTIGIYVDGVQILHIANTDYTTSTFTGPLVFAQDGADGFRLYGTIRDISIELQNRFGAVPVVGLTDTLTMNDATIIMEHN